MSGYRYSLILIFQLMGMLITATARGSIAPDSNVVVKISLSSSHNWKPPINVVIYKTGNATKIICSVFDNIDSKAMAADTAFANADRLFKAGNLDPLIKLSTKHHLYLHDTINVANDSLNNLIGLLSTTENLSPDDKNRVVLDGTHVGLEIITSAGTKKIVINSPGSDYHPITHQFVKMLIGIYRQTSKKDILREYNTGGY